MAGRRKRRRGRKRFNNVDRVERHREEGKGECIHTGLCKHLQLHGWKCEGERDDELKEAFYTFWHLAAVLAEIK